MNDKKESKKEKQISQITDRIAEKRIGQTGSHDVQLLTLIRLGELLEESNRLLRKIAKLPEVAKKQPWWKLGL